jgi:hypothetical protein
MIMAHTKLQHDLECGMRDGVADAIGLQLAHERSAYRVRPCLVQRGAAFEVFKPGTYCDTIRLTVHFYLDAVMGIHMDIRNGLGSPVWADVVTLVDDDSVNRFVALCSTRLAVFS